MRSGFRAPFVLAIALLAACVTPPAFAQRSHPKFPVTDGLVRSIAIEGDRVYVSGEFRLIGTPNGGAALTDTSTGRGVSGFPDVDGKVFVAIADGEGGWYLGGEFDRVGGEPRSNLAHVRADLGVDAWAPRTDAPVRALQRLRGSVFVGGDFTSVDGTPRAHLAAVDAITGALLPWDVPANATVRAMATFDDDLCIGGDFTTVAGERRGRLAGIDATTGALTPWAPDADASVQCIAIDEHILYAGGDFMRVSGAWRHRLAAIRLDDQSVTPWNGTADGRVIAIAVAGGRVYVGGLFRQVGGKPRVGLAALSKRWWQALDGWDPQPGPGINIFTSGQEVTTLAVAGDRVYVGGTFNTIAGTTRYRLAALDTATGRAAEWRPPVNGTACAIVPSGDRVFVGGDWTCSGGEERGGVAAIDRVTERVLPWRTAAVGGAPLVAARPGVVYIGALDLRAVDSRDGHELWSYREALVRSLLATDSTLYVGSDFMPTPMGNLRAMNASNGSIRWSHRLGTGADNTTNVDALAVADGLLYAGGAFYKVDDRMSGGGIAVFDAVTGARVWGTGIFNTEKRSAFVAEGSHVIAGDLFTLERIDARANTITALSPSTFIAQALDIMDGRLYAGGYAWAIQPTVLSVDLASGHRTAWQPDLGGAHVTALAAADGVVYLGGSMAVVNGQRRWYLAAIDDTTSFVPLAAAAPGGIEVALSAATPNPFTASTRIAFRLPRVQRATLDVLDLAGRRVATLTDGMMSAGPHEFVLRGERLAAGIYWARLTSEDGTRTRRIVRLP